MQTARPSTRVAECGLEEETTMSHAETKPYLLNPQEVKSQKSSKVALFAVFALFAIFAAVGAVAQVGHRILAKTVSRVAASRRALAGS